MRKLRYAMIFLGTCLIYASPAPAIDFVSAQAGAAKIVASQGEATVTLGDIDAFAQGIPEERRAGFFDSPKRIQNVIINLLLEKQLAAQALGEGLDKSAVVQVQLELARTSALAKARVQQYRRDLKVPNLDPLAHEYYVANKNLFQIPERISIEEVEVTTANDDTESAQALAVHVRSLALESGSDLSQAIQALTDDQKSLIEVRVISEASANNVPEVIRDAIGKLKKPLSISPVLNLGSSFVVLRLTNREPAHLQSFDEVSDRIKKQLESDFVNKKMAALKDDLRNLPLDANPEAVASLRTRYGVTSPATSK